MRAPEFPGEILRNHPAQAGLRREDSPGQEFGGLLPASQTDPLAEGTGRTAWSPVIQRKGRRTWRKF